MRDDKDHKVILRTRRDFIGKALSVCIAAAQSAGSEKAVDGLLKLKVAYLRRFVK